MFASWQESYDKPRQCAEKQSHYSPDKGSYSQSYGLPIELDCKEGRVLKNWCLQIMVLEKTPESPLDRKEIKPVSPKGNQPWIFTGRTDREAEAPVILVTWCKQLTHLKSPWCWERLRAEGEKGIRRWDGWKASLMQWTWTWANFGRWWGTERAGVLQSMGSQRVRHNWATKQHTHIYIWCVLSVSHARQKLGVGWTFWTLALLTFWAGELFVVGLSCTL